MLDPAPLPAILVTPKPWWRSRLMAAGTGVTLYGLANFIVSFAPTIGSPGGRWGGIWHVLLGLAVAYLRTQTSRPIAGTKKAEGEGGQGVDEDVMLRREVMSLLEEIDKRHAQRFQDSQRAVEAALAAQDGWIVSGSMLALALWSKLGK